MTISVVIPAYNEEKYLPGTLTSLQKLDRKPDEIIVIDGGSTDKTSDVAKQNGATVVTVPHRGIGFARQKGVEAANGDVVAFTDADTTVPHDWLTKIEETLHVPNVSGTYGGYAVKDGPLIYKYFINFVYPWILQFSVFLGSPMPGGQNIAFWKSKGIEAGGFPIEFKSVEDFEMIRRLKTTGKVIYRKDNTVTSSGRRGNEGFPLIVRFLKGFLVYSITRKANTFDFPDIR